MEVYNVFLNNIRNKQEKLLLYLKVFFSSLTKYCIFQMFEKSTHFKLTLIMILNRD